MYEFMTKSVAKPGVTAKALHHIKKMYSTIAKLSDSDLQEGYYDRLENTSLSFSSLCNLLYRVQGMWANYYKELNNTLEKPNKGYVKLSTMLRDVLWLRWGNRGKNCTAPTFVNHKTVV